MCLVVLVESLDPAYNCHHNEVLSIPFIFSCRYRVELVRIPGPPALDLGMSFWLLGCELTYTLSPTPADTPHYLLIASEILSFEPDVRQALMPSNPDQACNDYIDHLSLFFKIQGRASFGQDLYFTLEVGGSFLSFGALLLFNYMWLVVAHTDSVHKFRELDIQVRCPETSMQGAI